YDAAGGFRRCNFVRHRYEGRRARQARDDRFGPPDGLRNAFNRIDASAAHLIALGGIHIISRDGPSALREVARHSAAHDAETDNAYGFIHDTSSPNISSLMPTLKTRIRN